MACSSEHTVSATQCWMVRSVSDWIVLKWKLYYFILLVETKLQATEKAYSFKLLLAWVNRTWTIVLRQVIDLNATYMIKDKLCMLLRVYVFPILAQYIF